jgi:hypothetical protein
MAKLTEERKTAIRNVMLAGSLALGSLAAAVLGNPVAAGQGPFRPGDTPVVLVGGSLRFKAGRGAAGDAWQQVTQYKEYFYPASYQVKVIVLKNKPISNGDNPDPDDSDQTTDKTAVPISDPTAWRIDLFTSASPSNPVAHLVPQANGKEIHIILDDPNGSLCPKGNPIKRVNYESSGNCTNKKPKFSQIKITVNGQPPPSPLPSTLTCQDAMGDPQGKCKFVLRAQ